MSCCKQESGLLLPVEVPLAEQHTKLSWVCADHCDMPCVRSWGKLRRTTEPLSLLALLCSLELCPYLMYIGAGSGITFMVVSWPWSCSTFSQQSASACIKMSCRSKGTSLSPLLCWPVTTSWSERRKDALNPHFFLVTWKGFAKCGP